MENYDCDRLRSKACCERSPILGHKPHSIDVTDNPGVPKSQGRGLYDCSPGVPRSQGQGFNGDNPGVPRSQGRGFDDDNPGVPRSQGRGFDDYNPGVPRSQGRGLYEVSPGVQAGRGVNEPSTSRQGYAPMRNSRVRRSTSPENYEMCVPVRYVQVLMMFLGLIFLFCVRVIMSLAIVAMTDPNSENSFDWSIKRQSIILSSFNWGYITLQGISGELASKFGGRNLILISISVNSIASLLLPSMATYGGWIAVCVCRVVQGFTQGVLFPSIHYLISKWVPIDEKSRMTSFIFSGNQLGTAIQLMVSGFIANSFGWEFIFYLNGILGVVYTIAYWVLGSNSPQASRIISAEERLHIQTSLGHIGGHKTFKTPWKSILTSVPFLSLVIVNIGNLWGFWTLFTEVPTYMSKVHGVDIKSNGVISALPYLTMSLMSYPVGFTSDYVLKKKWVSVTTCRKISNSIGMFGEATALTCLAYVPANVTTAVLFLTLSQALHAGCYNGYIIVYLDMAPNFASHLMAISIFISNFTAMFAPLAVGFILEDETNPKEWRLVFFITVFLLVFTNVVYLIFGTSKRQKWNDQPETSSKFKKNVI